jgi:hypothetical protein
MADAYVLLRIAAPARACENRYDGFGRGGELRIRLDSIGTKATATMTVTSAMRPLHLACLLIADVADLIL